LLIGTGFADDYPVLKKEIRALDPQSALRYLLSSGVVKAGRVIEPSDLPGVVEPGVLVTPDEDVTRGIVQQYALSGRATVRFVPTFLRWDREWSKAARPPGYDGKVSADEYARRMQRLARQESGRSSDWWRQVGALAVKDEEIIAEEHN